MIKTKKKNIQLPLVITGYVLFSLLVVTTFISTTIPFGILLFNPRVLHYNVAVTLIALTVGALLPVLLGYIIGDNSVKSKSKLGHHFNGILFGLLAYWLMTIMAVLVTIPDELFTDRNLRLVLLNLFPGIEVAIMTTILAIAHVRSRQAKQDILEYKPFSIVLIASALVLPVWSLVNNMVTNSVSVYSFISLTIVVVLGLVSYVTLRKTRLSNYVKVLWSAVSISVVFVMVYVSSLLVYSVATYLDPRPTMESQAVVIGVGFVLAFISWIIYWSNQVKVLR
ncbi:MAG: hypothetical protein JWM52_394 [Candidatus Saccharibacteria bacterium]|nr:hypothetical protein [Candidatus Saccharibacteria bacterium]